MRSPENSPFRTIGDGRAEDECGVANRMLIIGGELPPARTEEGVAAADRPAPLLAHSEVDGMRRNHRTTSIGMGGRHASESAARVCVHEGAPGRVSACSHVPGGGSLHQRILRRAESVPVACPSVGDGGVGEAPPAERGAYPGSGWTEPLRCPEDGDRFTVFTDGSLNQAFGPGGDRPGVGAVRRASCRWIPSIAIVRNGPGGRLQSQRLLRRDHQLVQAIDGLGTAVSRDGEVKRIPTPQTGLEAAESVLAVRTLRVRPPPSARVRAKRPPRPAQTRSAGPCWSSIPARQGGSTTDPERDVSQAHSAASQL